MKTEMIVSIWTADPEILFWAVNTRLSEILDFPDIKPSCGRISGQAVIIYSN